MSDSPASPPSGGGNEETVVRRSDEQTSLRAGTVLSNTYKIERLLARGGMGEVYRARHLELGTEHAIKLILPELAQDPLVIRLFVEEARQLGRINNDAIVQYQGFLRDERGARYLVMEFVDGNPLAKVLDAGRFQSDDVLALLERLGRGLSAVHERGIVHRDISPANIILPGGVINRAKLIDFGIAKSAEPSPLTLVGSDFAGKFSFASPEQLGLFDGVVDQRSDIYSFGLVLAAAAIGDTLDMGTSLASVIEARQRVPDLSSLPVSLRQLIAAMLQPDPADRPSSMAAVIEQARKIAGGSVAAASGHDGTQSGAKKKSWVAWLLMGLVAAAAVTTAGLYLMPKEQLSVAEITARVARTTSAYSCADLAYAMTPERALMVTGTAASAADVAKLRSEIDALSGIAKLRFDVQPRPWPYCDIFRILKPLVGNPDTRVSHLSLAGDAQTHIGSPLMLDVGMPRFDGYVYVDYFSGKGDVLHLLPNNWYGINLRPALNRFYLGKPPQHCWQTDGAVGKQAVTVVVADAPLFAERAPDIEDGRAYLQRLSTAVNNAGSHRQAAGVLMFDVLPTKQPPDDKMGCDAQ